MAAGAHLAARRPGGPSVSERDDWARLDALLDAALDRPPDQRAAFVNHACGSDPRLRERLQALVEIAGGEDAELRPGGALEATLGDELARHADDAAEAGLASGAQLGRYEILGLLGEGGMGRVYRARDTALGREVAVKALAGAFRRDAARLRRFEREARLLAVLNHPNVAAIYGVEFLAGLPYLVLELVEGPTLGERLERGRLPWREAVGLALQVARALEEAHRNGVVHRDLKPSNVKLARDGTVKVLDFGLAKSVREGAALASVASVEGTRTLNTTQSGALLGTAPYMSPEQARGEAVDTRSDVWAFGCLLYEMLCGRRAFDGASLPDVLASVLRDEPDLKALPREAPRALGRLVERCLRKPPRQRLQDVGDARLELEELQDERDADAALRRPAWFVPALGLAALGAGMLLAGGLGGRIGGRRALDADASVLRLAFEPPAGLRLPTGYAAPFALAPDGRSLVFVARDGSAARLYVRALGQLEARPLAGTEGAWQPFLSPDGRSVAFFADRWLKRASLAGGAPLELVEVGGNPRGGSFAPDGSIVFSASQTSGLSLVGREGGAARELTRPDLARGERSHRWPDVLPGGDLVLFTVDHEGATFDDAHVEVLSLRTGERRRLVEGGSYARYLPGGYLLFARAGRLFAVRFDPARAELLGRPRLVLEGVAYDERNGAAKLAVAGDGTLLYQPGPTASLDREPVWVDPSGARIRLPGAARRFLEPRVSPEGLRVALRIGPPGAAEVWVQDLENGTLRQQTFGLRPARPVFTHDGRALIVGAPQASGWALLEVPLDGGTPRRLFASPHLLYPAECSANGRLLVFQERRPETGWDLRVLELDAHGEPAAEPRDLAATPAQEMNPRVSPDGRFVAFESDELDAIVDVYVAPLPAGSPRLKVSASAGRWPVWAGADHLYYWVTGRDEMRHARLQLGPSPRLADDAPAWPEAPAGEPPPSAGLYVTGDAGFDYDARTRRLLLLQAAPPEAPAAGANPILVTGFAREVAAREAGAAGGR